MRKLLTIISLLLLAISCSSQNQDININQKIERIENGLIEFKSTIGMVQPDSVQLTNPKKLTERMKFYKVPGVSIAVINGNQIEWTKAYGVSNINTGTAVTKETIFEAASTSKFLTAVLVLHFVEKGVFDLDTDVNNYLKSWHIPDNEYTKNQKVTIRRLLTHKSGLPSTNFSHDNNFGYPTLINVLNGDKPALNKAAVPEFIPGQKWQYSNIGYDVIQILVEDVLGKPFQQIAEEIIFKPLGMINSSFNYPLDSEKIIREAMPHDEKGILCEPSMHLTALAHGGLTTTPTDLAKFTNEIMLSYQGKSEILLSQEMTKQLLNKEFDLDPNMFGMPISEGLGVFIMNEYSDLLFMHPGSNLPGLNCWLIGWPEKETAAVVMTNGVNGEILAMEIISAINLVYNQD